MIDSYWRFRSILLLVYGGPLSRLILSSFNSLRLKFFSDETLKVPFLNEFLYFLFEMAEILSVVTMVTMVMSGSFV